MKSMLCVALALSSAASGVHAGEARPAATHAAKPPSVLEGYRRYEESPPIEWRRANEDAAALGGHVGQMRGKAAATPRDRGAHKGMKHGGAR